jgi:dihydroorotate dehydrogenase
MVPSTRVLARLSTETGGQMPLVGVGGIETARHAFEKIRAGATAVQLYSAMTWRGLSLVPQIARGLEELLRHHGFAHVSDAVGTGRDDWL